MSARWPACVLVAALLAVPSAACWRPSHRDVVAHASASAPTVPPKTVAAGGVLRRREVDTAGYVGLSDLSYDPAGQLWSIAERQRALLPLETSGPRPTLAAPPLVLVGVPEAYDTESLAWLDAETVAIGTETQVARRQSDDIFLARRVAGEARVFDRLRMPYALWDMRAEVNRGIEGMCAGAGVLLAAGETVVRLPDGRRAAPVGRLRLADRRWTAFWLPLTSATGSVSALACRPTADGQSLAMWAIERHFGVTRLLATTVPLGGDGGVLTARIWSDLEPQVAGGLPNLEGLAQRRAGDPVMLITDNHYGRVTGPTELFEVAPPTP